MVPASHAIGSPAGSPASSPTSAKFPEIHWNGQYGVRMHRICDHDVVMVASDAPIEVNLASGPIQFKGNVWQDVFPAQPAQPKQSPYPKHLYVTISKDDQHPNELAECCFVIDAPAEGSENHGHFVTFFNQLKNGVTAVIGAIFFARGAMVYMSKVKKAFGRLQPNVQTVMDRAHRYAEPLSNHLRQHYSERMRRMRVSFRGGRLHLERPTDSEMTALEMETLEEGLMRRAID